MKTIIHTFVSKETIDYLFYMRDNYHYLSGGKLEFFVYTDNFDLVERLKNKFNVIHVNTDSLSKFKHELIYPGKAHALMIKAAMDNFSKEDVNVICDSDTVVLIENWDLILKDELRKVQCIGVPYTNPWHYQGMPCFIWIAFSKGFDIHKYEMADAFPLFETHLENVAPISAGNLAYYNMVPINDHKRSTILGKINKWAISENDCANLILADPCWDFPIFLGKNNISHKIMPYKGIHDISSKLFNNKMITFHFEYYLDGKLFCAHLEGSRGRPLKKCIESSEFYNGVENYVKSIF